MDLASLTRADTSKVPLAGPGKEQVLAELLDLQIRAGILSQRDGVLGALLERESKASTGIGGGVAVPHARHPLVDGVALGVGVSRDGVEFDSADGAPVHLVFLVLSGQQDPHLTVQVLARIGELARAPELYQRLVSAPNACELVEAFQ